MRLDLLVPTLRRPHLLKGALASIARALPPRNAQVAIIVINNDTRAELPGLDSVLGVIPFPTQVVHEPRPGKSAALNAGIAASSADYLGFIDDDEELAPDWFRVVEDALESGVDFLGGRQLPREPVITFPSWIPPGYSAVLGLADGVLEMREYGPGFSGMLMGGNAVISRATLNRIGPYSCDLGPRTGRRLLSGEDEDMYWRLIDAGARGLYVPQLVVYHHVHPERLRRSYYRAWCFWNGAAKGRLSRRRPPKFPLIAGVPRYLYGNAIRGILRWLRSFVRGPAHARMSGELPLWHLAGRLYGRHVRGDDATSPAPCFPVKHGDRAAATVDGA